MVGGIIEHDHHPLTSAAVFHNCLQERDNDLRIEFLMDLGTSYPRTALIPKSAAESG